VLLLRFVNRLRGGGDPPALIAQHIRQPLDGLFTMLGDTHLHDAPIFAGATRRTELSVPNSSDDGIDAGSTTHRLPSTMNEMGLATMPAPV